MALSLCACMGPIGDDPVCPCAMRAQGLAPTEVWTPEKKAELEKVLSECFGRKGSCSPDEDNK